MLDSAANSVGNIDIISYHLAFPSHMFCKYWRSLSLEHYAFWCFLGVLTFYVLDSAANYIGNIDIISYHLAFPSHMICKYWRSFISGTLYLLDPFGAFWGF